MKTSLLTTIAATIAATVMTTAPAHSQPADTGKPVRFIIPLGPGSGTDSATRTLADIYGAMTGKVTVAENRPGGDMVIAVQTLLNAPADGTSILYLTPTSVVINPVLRSDLPYDVQRDIKPVAWISRGFAVMVVSGDSPYRSLADLVTAAKADPGKLVFANYGHHYRLGAVSLENATGTKFTHVPYKGASQANNDVIGGAVDVHVTDIGGALPLIQSGKLRAIAVTGDTRHPYLPEVPTIAESGYPDFNLYVWTGFAVHGKTPDSVAKKIEEDLLKAIKSEKFAQYSKEQGGSEVTAKSGEALAAHIASETKRYRDLVK